MTRVRAELARVLWSRGRYVGVTVLDELLFDALSRGAAEPVHAVLRALLASPLLSRPGSGRPSRPAEAPRP